MKIKFKKLVEEAVVPKFATAGAAGMDVCSTEKYIILPGETHVFKTGIAVAVEEGYEVQVRSRSGLAAKHSIMVLNSPGTIDSDYRGEIGVILHNASNKEYVVCEGDRIAQLVVNKIEQPEIEVVESLDETERGNGGFGSTGI